MDYSPEERERVARILRQKTEYTEEQIQREVDNCFKLAEATLEVWSRRTAKGSKLASAESKPESQGEQHPP